MKRVHVLTTAIFLTSIGACSKNNKGGSNPPEKTREDAAPVVTLGLNGGLAAGKVDWTLPAFLEGQFKDLDKAYAEASLEIDLVKEDDRKSARVNTGLSIEKSCDLDQQVGSFLAVDATPENAPPSRRTDIEDISSWEASSKTFEGRVYFKKRYKSEGHTGIYRLDALMANTKSSECVHWNFVFTPEAGSTAAFVEASAEYKALMTSLSTTWKGLGADFED